MTCEREEWYTLEPEDTSQAELTRPESVISDICTEGDHSAAYFQQNLSSKINESCSDVSDILSPDRKGYQFRVPPVGVNGGINSRYLDRSVTGQEGASTSHYKNTEESFTKNFLEEVAHNLSSDALQKAFADLSQHELEPSLVQHCLGNTHETTRETDSGILRNMSDKSELTQNPLGISTSVNESDSNRNSLAGNQASDLTQYLFSEQDVSKQRASLSQYPLESSGEMFEKSSGDTEGMLMLNSKDSRPGTIIERPLTEGENEKDKQSFVTAHITQDSQNSHFDHSIKYGHGHHQETLGDTLLYSDKKPVGSSTPFSDRPSNDGAEFTKQLESLPNHQIFKIREGGSETDSDSNISKFMKKAGVDNYLPVDQRESLMAELSAAQQTSSEASSSVKDMDSEKGRSLSNRSPSQRSASSSPGRFHDLIPDTPSFRGDTFPRQGSPSQRSVSSQRSRTSQVDDYSNPSLEQYTLGESAVQKSSRSGSADSHSGAADISNLREKFSRSSNHNSENGSSGQRSERSSLGSQPQTMPVVDSHRRNSGSSSDARDEPHQYKSSDTLLGYEGRDAMSLGSSGGSHPHTPRSLGSGKDNADSGEDRTIINPADFMQRNTEDKHGSQTKSDTDEDKTSVKSDKSTGSQKSQESRQSYTSNVGSVISVSSQRSKASKQADEEGRHSLGRSAVISSNDDQSQVLTSNSLGQSLRSPTEGQEVGSASIQGSFSSTRTRQSPSNVSESSYKDEKWANKVTGVLDSVTRRQNLSQRVASLLATAPPSTPRTATNSEKSTPLSRRSSQGQEKTPIPFDQKPQDPKLLNTEEKFFQEAAAVANFVQMAKESALSSDDEARRLSTNMDASSLTMHSGTTSEDEDVERITGEYKAILQGVTHTVEIGGDMDALKAKLLPQEINSVNKQSNTKINTEGELETDDALDKDVKRILAKYGKTVPANIDAEDDAESEITGGRHSPAGSAYDTDDTLSQRVHKLLTKPTNQTAALKQGVNYGNELELTGKSADSLLPSGLGSLQHRIDEVKLNGEPIGRANLKATQSVSDAVNDRVRNILADDDEEDATSKQVSSIGTRSQSRTSSIDYMNLERDLDEIQSNLESLKGDIGLSGHESDVSEQSVELLKYIEHKTSDDTLQRTRAALEDDDLEDSTSSLSCKRLDPEGHGKSPPAAGTMTQLPISPLLTSGVIPMDLALDMIHGDAMSKYPRYYSPGGQSGYSMQSADTDTLLRNAGYTDSTPQSRDDSIQQQWRHSRALADRAPSNLDSLTDREVMEINGVKADTTQEESITERISKLVDNDTNFQSKDESDIHIEYDQVKDQYAYMTPKGDYQYTSKESATPGYSMGEQLDSPSPGLDISSFSPLTKKPFSAYGTMESLLTSQRDKVSISQFDKSVEIGSPYKRQTGSSGPLRLGVDGEGIGRRSPLYGRDNVIASPTEDRIHDPLRSSIGRESSPNSNRSSPRDGTASRRSSGSLNSMSGLRPYKPPGSREFFYVESGELDGMSETTVESTHPGSDDAIGPSLPPHVYGTRKDPSGAKGAASAYTKVAKTEALGTIQEQSLLAESNISRDTERQSQEAAPKPTKVTSRSSAGTPQGSHSSSERERSFTKAQNWVNGNWPSKEDLASVSTPTNTQSEDVRREVAHERDTRRVDLRNGNDDSGIRDDFTGRFETDIRNGQSKYDTKPPMQPTRYSLEGANSHPRYSQDENTFRGRHSQEESTLKPRYSQDGNTFSSMYPDEGTTLGSRNTQDGVTLQSRYSENGTLSPSKYEQSDSALQTRLSTDQSTLHSGYAEERNHAQSRYLEGTRQSQESNVPQFKYSDNESTLKSRYSTESGVSRPKTEVDRYSSEKYEVEPYDAYSEKCQNLQDKYKSLKSRAEDAISQLINESNGDDPSRPGYFRPEIKEPVPSKTSKTDDYTRKEERQSLRKDFGTPQRLGSSRLSLEMSLNETGRKSLGGKSLNESLRSVQSNSSNGSQDFLKYHPSTQQASIERPSNYRGPDYWSQVVKQNYDEMAKPVATSCDSGSGRPSDAYSGRPSDAYSYKGMDSRYGDDYDRRFSSEAVSHNNELRLIDKMEKERADRLSAGKTSMGRLSPAGQTANRLSPNLFSPLEPDMEGSPLKSRSPVGHAKSPYERTQSPYERSRSPYDQTKSQYERSKSPYEHSESNYEHSKFAYERSKSPYERERPKSPYERSRSPYEGERLKSPYERSPCNRLRVDRADPSYEMARSPHYRTKSPYEISRSHVSHGLTHSDPRNLKSPDLQDMWERFQSIQGDGESSPAVKVDLDKLYNLLSNPVHYMVNSMQEGTVFEDKERTRQGKSRIAREESGRTPNKYQYSERELRDGEFEENQKKLQILESRSDFQSADVNQGHQNSGHKGEGDRGNQKRQSSKGNSERKQGSGNSGAGGNGDDGDDERRKKPKDNHERNTTDEEQSEQTEEEPNAAAAKDFSEPQKRKMAWVIKDEELLSIPEDSTLDSVSSDFTTSSEIDSDGKIVTKTTKRHLPDDPKLLKLQQKIAKQKEKYKRELTREKRRKDKISRLEEMLLEQNKAQKSRHVDIKDDVESSRSTTATAKNTSTPSSVRHASQDSTLGISDITSTSTLTHATVISEDADYQRNADSTLNGDDSTFTSKRNNGEQDSDLSSICECCKHGKSKHVSRSVSPPKQSALKRTSQTQSHSTSPARRKREKSQEPVELKLREVNYMADKSLVDKERPSRKSVYLEIDKPKSNSMVKVKRMSVSPSKRKEKENLENIKKRGQEGQGYRLSKSPGVHGQRSSATNISRKSPERYPGKKAEEKRQRSRSGSNKNKERIEHSNSASQVTPKSKAKTCDFGMTCPTPIVLSPAVERTVRKVTMKSEAIQTDRKGNTPLKKEKSQSNTRRVMRKDHSPGMFTPETSGSEESFSNNNRRQDLKHMKAQMKKKMVQAAQEGVSWFIPMPEAKPWRKPLRERQANALAMETWPQMDEYTRKKVEAITLGYSNGKHVEMTKSLDRDEFQDPKSDLKTAFEKRMEAFISKSRERQKHIALRTEERKINEIHQSERMKLFHVDKKKEANLEAHPLSDLHFKPQRRIMTKQEMKELTRKKYAKLPEVNQKIADKKREEAYKTNRLRAQMYKKRIQTKVLHKKPFAVLA